jgi:Asp-tRNA(Asn)/Glu-tRNA(Gln) amidotransferase A subunit family amidase
MAGVGKNEPLATVAGLAGWQWRLPTGDRPAPGRLPANRSAFLACDLILLPTYLSPTIPIGAWRSVGSAQTLQNIINWIAPCPPFNASGQPAIAIPTGFDDSGLPVGVQLVGRPAADATVLAVAAQLEQMNPWAHQRPSLVSS